MTEKELTPTEKLMNNEEIMKIFHELDSNLSSAVYAEDRLEVTLMAFEKVMQKQKEMDIEAVEKLFKGYVESCLDIADRKSIITAIKNN